MVSVDRGTSLTTGVEETNVFKKRFPLQGGQQARNTEGEVDRVNDTIKKIKINTVETPDEPQVPYHEQGVWNISIISVPDSGG